MGFLRRLLGGAPADDDAAAQAPAVDSATAEAAEAERDLELLRADQHGSTTS